MTQDNKAVADEVISELLQALKRRSSFSISDNLPEILSLSEAVLNLEKAKNTEVKLLNWGTVNLTQATDKGEITLYGGKNNGNQNGST